MVVNPDFKQFGSEVEDAEEEVCMIFAEASGTSGALQQDLGMLDSKATFTRLTIGKQSYTLQQSPGLLRSDRKGGTTGAVAWQSSLRCAEWLSTEAGGDNTLANLLFGPQAVVIELGCGINPVVALTLENKVAKYFATDQEYLLKLYNENLQRNTTASNGNRRTKQMRRKVTSRHGSPTVETRTLDWELDDPSRGQPWSITSSKCASIAERPLGIDVLLAFDCIYNESLVQPFVDTCRAICAIRRDLTPTRCLIVQQLRSSDVLTDWISAMLLSFELIRIHDGALISRLTPSSGFVVYLGTLRNH